MTENWGKVNAGTKQSSIDEHDLRKGDRNNQRNGAVSGKFNVLKVVGGASFCSWQDKR